MGNQKPRIPLTFRARPGVRSGREAEDEFPLERLLAGESNAWDEFSARYRPIVRAAVRHLLGQSRSASAADDDFVQEVFLHLCRNDFRALRQFDRERAAFPTYLIVIARTVVLGFLRRRRPALDSLEEVPEVAVAPEPLPVLLSDIPHDLLSPRQQLILHLLYDRQLAPEQISKILGISQQTVRSLHHKAITKLRRRLVVAGEAGDD